MNSYTRFGVMIATSTIVMFGLMYLNTYQLDHVFFSETRAYMALVMGATMAVIMLAFMPKHVSPAGAPTAPFSPAASSCSSWRSGWCAARRPLTM